MVATFDPGRCGIVLITWLAFSRLGLNEELLGLGVPRRRLFLVVDVEADGLVGVDAEPLLDHLPYPRDPVGLTSVCKPNCKLVSLGSNIHHCTVHLQDQGSLIGLGCYSLIPGDF